VIADYRDLPRDLAEKNQKHFPAVIAELDRYVTL
jgi:hypothetical protein